MKVCDRLLKIRSINLSNFDQTTFKWPVKTKIIEKQPIIIKFSYHKDVIGKPIRDHNNKLWVGNKQVNLGYGWKTVELEFDELFVMLSKGGYAISPALISDHRIEENFLSHSIALVDIDEKMKTTDLATFDFYQKYGSGFYTTPSHTAQDHRFRIIYRLENDITSAQEMRMLYEGLLAIHGAADISCKDSVRLFYGTINAVESEITNRVLTQSGIAQALAKRGEIFSKKQQNNTSVAVTNTYATPELVDVQKMLDELKKHYPTLPYKERCEVSWAAYSVLSSATINEMRSRWNDSQLNGKYEDILRKPRSDGLTLGTIVHMIRQKDPNYRQKRMPEKDIKKIIERIFNVNQ
jgi:hypothetical protein